MAKEVENKVKKPFYKRWWFIVAVVLVVMVAVTGGDDEEIADGENGDNNNDNNVAEEANNDNENEAEETEVNEESNEANNEANNNEEANNEEEEAEELEDQTFGVGDVVEHNDYSLTVDDVEKTQGDDFDNPSDGNEYVIVAVTIDNNGEDTISYNPYHFSIQNSNGNITDQAFTTVDSDTSLSSGELAPGGTVSGTIAFEAPVDDPELELIFEPSFWTADEVRVSLN